MPFPGKKWFDVDVNPGPLSTADGRKNWRRGHPCGATTDLDGLDARIDGGMLYDLATVVIGLLDRIPDARGSRFEARQLEIHEAADRLRGVMRRGEP